jgi:spermidine synthase
LPRRVRALLSIAVTLTGFSALTLQVVWQRVISLHTGVDLVSVTTVVAAFLAGVGVGSLAGGALADRVGPGTSIRLFAVANVAIGGFAWISVGLFDDLYEARAAGFATPLAKFTFNSALLAGPTILMGLSLPLVAKGLVARRADAGPLIGRLYGLNTLGAAAGAATTGWLLLGTAGFTSTVRVAGALNLMAAGLVLAVPYLTGGSSGDGATPASRFAPLAAEAGRVWPWYVLYAFTGAVALGFEIVLFRLVDAALRSNSYSFAHVLSLYLALYGVGAAVASPLVRRARRPGVWFLWIEAAVGATALSGLVLLTRVVPRSPWAGAAQAWFGSEGLVTGFGVDDGSIRPPVLGALLLGVPLLLMAAPVAGMGAAFPFAQALVARRLDTLGRHTGRLLFANVAGNVAGTLAVGLVVLDRLGTAGTYRLLGLALVVPAIAAAWQLRRRWLRPPVALGAAAVMALLLAALPGNEVLYARLHGVAPGDLHLAEDRSCASALRVRPDGHEEMTVNASPQNDYPFDDFHLLLGLTPAMLHDDPRSVMVLGLGIGATAFGVSLDPRVGHVRTVELCGGQLALLRGLADRRSAELRRLLADPRVEVHIGDGRDDLLRVRDRYDVVVVDTLRPQAAFSGNLYSTEFYRLVHDRLGEHGLLAQWAPTERTLNSVLAVFPHVVQFRTRYHGSVFFVAGKQPIVVDQAVLAMRAAPVADPGTGLSGEQRASLTRDLNALRPACVHEPGPGVPLADHLVNRDLRPRDEYFLNQPLGVGVPRSCRPVESGHLAP